MLQKQTTPTETFELLTNLMKDPMLTDFHLAGGTAIALYLGHRISVDLDLFSTQDFDNTALEDYLFQAYNFKTDYKNTNTLKGTIQGVKIDCITSKSPLCENIQELEGVRLFGLKDIIAMKLLAIADNGTRLKDFIDIAYLSTKYSLEQMIEFAGYKFPNKSTQIFEKALFWHDDIIFSEPIILLEDDFQWKTIEQRLIAMAKDPTKVFETLPCSSTLQNQKRMR